MIGQQHLLRKAELERLSSPEQLDTAMRVTSPVGWVALVALGCLISGVVAWSIMARLPIMVDATGMLLRGADVKAVQVSAAGRVRQIKVKVGDLVEKGQIVAHLELAELASEIEATRARIGDLRKDHREWAARMGNLRATYQVQLNGLEAQLRNKKDLERRGLARKQDVLAVEGQIAQVKGQILQTQARDSDTGFQIGEQERELKKLTEQHERQSVVKSPSAGKVAALLVTQDELIDAGTRILSLEAAEDQPFQVLLFVPFADGKKVQADMPVRISPTTVKPEEFGYIKGRITEVPRLPVTAEEVRNTLNNEQLARRFAEDTPFRFVAVPEIKNGRFQWTSAKGETIDIDSSTPCTAQVIIDRRRPISYVIPKLKEIFGVT